MKRTLAAALCLLIPLTVVPAANAQSSTRNIPVVGDLATAHVWTADGSTPVVVLGAQLNRDCTAPAVLNERLDRAAQFLRLHPTNPVYVTGGSTQSGCPTEAAAMEIGLRVRLVPNPIIQENRSGNTMQNAEYVSQMSDASRMVLVSSQDHLPRAKNNFATFGVDTVGAALL